ncbi:uncharacterized protein LOC128244700 [Mya arenaria]|uniref:uncharacterized protein LOC128244700 n=1 Tax=Mya arenaria TaxID=6604 RepID=UPI0022E7C380|nr:uncharacterized protein LOC128244700 [Mya arenaria]
MMGKLSLFLLLLVLAQSGSTIKVSYTCQETDFGDFKLVLRLDREGNTDVTGVKAYADDGSGELVATTSTCETTVRTGGVYQITEVISTDDGDCDVTGSGPYDMIFRAEGTIQYYKVSCDTTKLLKTNVASSLFQTNAVRANLFHRPNPLDVKLQVVEADGSYVPTNNVYLGQDIKLRLILNKGGEEFGPDNWGYTFHTAITKDNDPDAELLLQLFTPGLGTEVKVEGQLSGEEFTCYAKVKRDDAVEIKIPKAYADETTASFNNWVTTNGGIKVTALHDRIGVKVIHRRPGTFLDAGRIVLPDDAIATLSSSSTYAYSLHISNLNTATFGLVAFEDSTTITINYNEYAQFAALEINGVNAEGSSDDVFLNEFQVFVIVKGVVINEIILEGDKPFGVFVESGIFTTASPDKAVGLQFLPKHTAALRYVLPFPDTYDFIYTIDDPVNDQGLTIETPGSTVTRTEGSQVFTEGQLQSTSDAIEIRSTNPVHVQAVVPTTASQDADDRAGFVLPSIEQWSPRQYFYAEEGKKYDLHFVSYKGNMANIKIKLGTIATSLGVSTLGGVTGFATSEVTRVQSESGVGTRFEYYEHIDFEVTNTDDYRTESGLVEFQAAPNMPFMLIIFEKSSSGVLHEAYLGFGIRFPPINSCTDTTSDHTFSPQFADSFSTKPGDLLDNDCDGFTDEEMLNGVDDDGDGKIDEDLALREIYERGIKAVELVYAIDAGFNGLNYIIQYGCQTFEPKTTNIGHFTLNTALSDVFDDYWVIETNAFSMFKVTSESELFFGAVYDICYDGNLPTTCAQETISECDDKRRKRRDAFGYDSEHFATVHVRISENGTKEGNYQEYHQENSGVIKNKNPVCTKESDFWLSVYGLVAIILLELFMIGGMISYKRHVIKSLQ